MTKDKYHIYIAYQVLCLSALLHNNCLYYFAKKGRTYQIINKRKRKIFWIFKIN